MLYYDMQCLVIALGKISGLLLNCFVCKNKKAARLNNWLHQLYLLQEAEDYKIVSLMMMKKVNAFEHLCLFQIIVHTCT